MQITVKVSLIQLTVEPGNIAKNEERAEQMIIRAAESGSELIILPELWNCGYDLKNLNKISQKFHDSSVNLLRKLARRYQVCIFGGSIAEKKDGGYFNTAVVVDQKGFVTGKYRKIHLFPMGLEEDKYFSPGEEWGLVDTPWGTAGIILCYDLRFPELMRNLVLRGAKFIVVPAQWPASRVDHWVTLSLARAIENQVFVLACNRTGSDGTVKYAGRSLAVSPWGQVLAGGEETAEIISAEIDINETEKARKMIPVFSDRRNLLDEIDNGQL